MNFSQLIKTLELRKIEFISYYVGNDPKVFSAASLELATENDISFLEKGNSLSSILTASNAGSIIIPEDDSFKFIVSNKGIAFAIAKDPRLAFAESLDILYPKKRPKSGIHPTAVIETKKQIGGDTSIGANVFIGNGSSIGNNVIIHPGVVIYEDVVVKDNCELHANCVIHSRSNLGKDCVVNSNAVIGSEGFGFVPTPNGWRKMPQTGKVILEENVEIGSGSTVDRPAVGETLIGAGTKIDNLVQIGHGVITGKACAMASQVGIAGGAKLGDNVILAGQVGVANRVSVGDRVIASSKCGIHTDIEKGSVISGFPAMSNRLWLKCSANFKKLPLLAKSLKEISKDLANQSFPKTPST